MKQLFQRLRKFFTFSGGSRPHSVGSPSGGGPVPLEEQLETLEPFGLVLNEGVTTEDLLYSWDRREYEDRPYDTLLIMFGSEVEREPWGRNVCDREWNLDVECIEGTGFYEAIVNNLSRIAGLPSLISDVEDFVDIDRGTAWLKYSVDGQRRHFDIPVDDDWADPETVSAIMRDIERDGKRFYAKDNGQASCWFHLAPEAADRLNALTTQALKTRDP